jgi:hypothetical protein
VQLTLPTATIDATQGRTLKAQGLRPTAIAKEAGSASAGRRSIGCFVTRLSVPFRRAEQNKATGIERVVKGVAHPLLQDSIEVDQNIAAGDQVDMGEGGILEQVTHCEQNRIAHLLPDSVSVAFTVEEPPQTIFADVSFDRGWIAATPRHSEGPGIEVRAEHLDGRAKFVLCGFLMQQHCDRIGLFPHGAAWHPDPYRRVQLPSLEQARQHLGPEWFESLVIAKKSRHRYQKIAQQGVGFIGALAQDLVILRQVFSPRHVHAACETPEHGRTFVFGKIMSGANPQMSEHPAEQLLVNLQFLRLLDGPLDANELDEPCGRSRTGRMKSATPDPIALRGMDEYSASSGSCTRMMPPASLTARTPMAPSEPAPLRMIAKPLPRRSVAERKKPSIGARFPRGSSNSVGEISWSINSTRRSGGRT